MTRKNQTIASLAFQERRAKRRVLANQDHPKEGTVNTFWRSIVIVGIICLTVLCLAGCFLTGFGGWLASRPVETNVAPTNTPVSQTTVPEVVATAIPMPVSCTTPSIKAGLNAAETEFGEYLDTNLGERMTFTSRRPLVPDKKWNDPLTPEELKTVEETWQFMQVCIPDGTTGVIFAGGFEQGVNRYETGALLSLTPGLYEFKMRNGEVTIWYPGQETFVSKDLERIVLQIRTGNFDIKSPLAFLAATADLFAKVPQDLVKERNVQIAPAPDPVVQ